MSDWEKQQIPAQLHPGCGLLQRAMLSEMLKIPLLHLKKLILYSDGLYLPQYLMKLWDKWHWFILAKSSASVIITFRQGIRHGKSCKISSWACSYHSSWTPELSGFLIQHCKAFPLPQILLLYYSCIHLPHFLSFVVNDRYVPLDYAHLTILCIIIYEMMAVLAGNLTAIVMPKNKETDGRHPSS